MMHIYDTITFSAYYSGCILAGHEPSNFDSALVVLAVIVASIIPRMLPLYEKHPLLNPLFFFTAGLLDPPCRILKRGGFFCVYDLSWK